MTEEEIEGIFPDIAGGGYSITSPATPEYNCIAWAATDTKAWWWPDINNQYYWPADIPREETLEAFIKAYETLGYETCKSGGYEEEFEKIAIYLNASNKPTHAARQLGSGRWTSKLGTLEDIEHVTLDGLYGSSYGVAAVFMRRAI